MLQLPVEIKNLTFTYRGSQELLFNEAELTLRPGEVSILAGCNGSGKSTLLQLILGDLSPGQGEIRLFGCNPMGLNRIPEVGFVAEPLHFYSSPIPTKLTGVEVANWLKVIDGIEPDVFYSKIDELQLNRGVLKRCLASYSKGERQRFLLAVVLSRSPRLILADEPMEGLDSQCRLLIGSQFRKFAHDGGTVLWVSHHIGETLFFADRYFTLEDKKIVERSSGRYSVDIKTEEQHSSVSLASLMQLPTLAQQRLENANQVSFVITQNKE